MTEFWETECELNLCVHVQDWHIETSCVTFHTLLPVHWPDIEYSTGLGDDGATLWKVIE